MLQEINGATVQSATDNNGASQGVFQNVPAGSYYVIVTDATGCSYTNNVIVNGPTAPLNVTVATTDPTFGSSNGSITITASGGTAPYTYSIDNGQTWQTSNTFSNLGQGVYIIMVEDANGCSYIYCVQLVQVTNCAQVITATASPVSCAGISDGEIDYAFTSDGSAAPFVVEVISGNNTIQTATYAGAGASGTFSNLPSGVYLVTLTGANGCTITAQVYIDEPDPLVITNVTVSDATFGNSDGSATVSVSGGTAPYSYSLNAGAP